MDVLFDVEAHEYTLNGAKLPSVTAILEAAKMVDYSHVDRGVLELAAQFGKAAHKATELYDQNTLNMKTLALPLVPYLQSWIEFRNTYRPEVLLIEEIVFSERYGYAGTLDRLCRIDGKITLIDIKTSTSIPPATALQTAGYVLAFRECYGERVQRRLCVQLRESGTPKVQEFAAHTTERDTFLSALNCYHWRKEHKLLKGE